MSAPSTPHTAVGKEGSEGQRSRKDGRMIPLLPGLGDGSRGTRRDRQQGVHSVPPPPRTHRITITNFCLGKHLVSEGDLLKDQRGSPAYISPDVLSGTCGVPGSGSEPSHSQTLRPFVNSANPICGLQGWRKPVLSPQVQTEVLQRMKTILDTPVHV